jgi:hypothetical protein
VNNLKHCGAFREASPEIAAQLSGASKSLRHKQHHALAAFLQLSRAAIVIVDLQVTRQRSSGMPAASPEPLHSSRPFPLLRARPRLRFT